MTTKKFFHRSTKTHTHTRYDVDAGDQIKFVNPKLDTDNAAHQRRPLPASSSGLSSPGAIKGGVEMHPWKYAI